jgi:hypothetical protein
MMTGGLGDHSGITSLGSMERRVQYKSEIKSSNGVEIVLRVFLKMKRVGERVRSEARPERKDRVVMVRPIMVRYWRCQP